MHRIELGDIAPRDQMIEIAFLGSHRQHIGLDGRRDDRMMRRDLLIIPGPALDLHIRLWGPFSHQRIAGIRKIGHNGLRIAELIRRQVFAVRTRIGRELLLIELLGRIQYQLRCIAIHLARQHLQRREREWQWLRFLLLAFLVGRDQAVMRLLLELGQLLLSHLLVDQPVLTIQPGHRILRLPLRLERAIRMPEVSLDRVIIHRLEMLDLALAANHQRQCRRLDAANRQDQLVMPGPSGRQRIRPRQVHADQPVRPSPGQSRLLQVEEIPVFPEAAVGLLDTLLIQGIQQDPFDRLRIPQIIQYLIHEQLPFSVRVSAMDDLIRLFDQRFHDSKLLLTVLRYEQLPVLRDDWQVFGPPPLIFRIIFIRLSLTQDMAEKPGHDAITGLQIAVMTDYRSGQALGQLTPHTWFLGNIYTQCKRHLLIKKTI